MVKNPAEFHIWCAMTYWQVLIPRSNSTTHHDNTRESPWSCKPRSLGAVKKGIPMVCD